MSPKRVDANQPAIVEEFCEVTIPGRPIPWARARKGKRGFFTPLKQAAHREAVALMFRGAMKANGGKPFEGPVAVDVEFDYGAKETRVWVISLQHNEWHKWKATRGDLDNLVKQIFECIQDSGLLTDDAQVAALRARKVQ